MRLISQAIRLGWAPLKWATARLQGRPDSEHEMSLNRLVFAAMIVFTLVLERKTGGPDRALTIMMIYIALALAVLFHIVIFPGVCRPRRVVALLLDCGFLSWQLHLGGEHGALFYPVYLWIIFGNAFRFGLTFLAAAVPVSALCFGLVIATTPYWQKQLDLSIGLIIGLIILPAYSGTLIRKLSLAIKNAEEANQAKSLFLASVSHELRTPLAAITGMTGLLRRSTLNDEQSEMVKTVSVATQSLQMQIDELLDLSRIEAGRMPNVPEELDLLSLLMDVRRMVETQVHAKNLYFDIHVTPRTPPFLLANRRHLYEILVNLTGNAVKFTETGGVVIAVDGHAIEGTNRGVTLTIEVSDTGIGIAPQDQARIFDDFTQANGTILNRFGGTGLGLAITRRRVVLLGGSIAVESELGRGSTFRVSIMVHSAINMVEPALLEKASVTLAARNREIVEQVGAGLAAIGAAVTVAEPGRAALPPGHGRILLVHASDLDLIAPACRDTHAAIVLIDETAAQSLPAIAVRRRCAAILSDVSSLTALRRVLMTAMYFANIPAADAPEPAAVTETPPVLDPVRRRRVLLVDDNRVNQRVFTRILESAGHEVVTANNGEQALNILEDQAGRLDVVLMDFNMPEMDGLEATKLFRVMSRGDARLPIIGLTADASAKSDSRWRDADMDGCLIKPVDPPALLAAIDAIARNASSPAGNSVAILQEHPRFRKASPPALDDTAIGNLLRLGDRTFVGELLSDFLADATRFIATLSAAAVQGDTSLFRDQAHALRSSAINVGATALCELCEPWAGDRGSELRARAGEFAARAQAELARTRAAINKLAADRPASDARLS
jgi:two-component system sensor histidine kinase RpfC